MEHAKPDPDLLLAAADRLGADFHSSIVVGDSVWDLLAAPRADTLESNVSRVVMGKMNSNAQEPTSSIRIRAIF